MTRDPELSARLCPPPSEECIKRIEELERATRYGMWRARFIRMG